MRGTDARQLDLFDGGWLAPLSQSRDATQDMTLMLAAANWLLAIGNLRFLLHQDLRIEALYRAC